VSCAVWGFGSGAGTKWAGRLQCLRLWRVWLAGGEGRVKKVGSGVVLGCWPYPAVGVFMA
jgi:hypothetical protein